MTLAFEDASSKLLDGVSVAYIDAQERAGDSMADILKLKFGQDFQAEIWWSL